MSTATIYTKLAAVMAAIDGIDKKGKNTEQHYNYVRATDVANVVRKECIKQGILIIPSVVEDEHFIFERIAGKPNLTVRLRVEFIVQEVEGPGVFSFYGVGYGLDSGDKGVYKAMTGALKYGLRSLFLVPDETDPENDSKETREAPEPERTREERPKLATEAQRRKVLGVARDKGLDATKLKALGRSVTAKESSTEWLATDIDKVLEALNNQSVVALFLDGEIKKEDVA